MNSVINDITNITWSYKKEPVREEDLFLVQHKIPFTLPKKFIDLLKIGDGGYLNYGLDYYDVWIKRIIGSGIGVIYSAGDDKYKDDLINAYYEPPEFFPKNLVPFGGNGGSDQICFDYRADPKTHNPPVVYWIFGSKKGEDVSPLADNFMEFLKILREREHIENYLKK